MAKIHFGKFNLGAIGDGIRFVKKFGKQHLPTILTVTGLGLSVYAKYLTAMESIKAHQAIKAEEEKRAKEAEENGTEPEELTKLERAKIWGEYCWPSMVAETGSIVCIGISDRIDWKLLMTMTGLYQGTKGELADIKERIVERDGKGALKKMEKEYRRERAHPEKIHPDEIWETGKGNTLFYDLYTGAAFHSSISYVNTAITQLNTMLQESQGYGEAGYVELTDFLELLGEGSQKRKCGKNVAFRYNSPRDVIHPMQVVDWEEYVDPVTGEPRIAYIDYEKYLTPSDDFIERRPY